MLSPCLAAVTKVKHSVSRVRSVADRLRHAWLRVIGAPDYQAYLAHHAERHPGTPPMSERDYVNVFIERRYNGRASGRCC
jgi:uncharacterized short protein YbdD (DUF466 family)